MAVNNLYPPILKDSVLPAFLYNNYCQVNFAISELNSVSELHSTYPVQIAVYDLKTNQSVLKSDSYPSGIKLSNMSTDSSREEDDKYYIRINSSDIQGGFKLNQYYKVQIRFTASGASNPGSNGRGLGTWLSNNQDYFSEWSTSVLIYGISQPSLSLKNLTKNETTTLNNVTIPIVGKVSFEAGDKETLKSYRIELYDVDNNLIEDTDEIFVKNKNEINYSFIYSIVYNTTYTMKIYLTTKNLYKFNQTYYIFYYKDADSDLSIGLSVSLEEQSGCIRLHFYSEKDLTSGSAGQTYDVSLLEPSVITPTSAENTDRLGSSIYNSSSFEFPINSTFTLRRCSSKRNFNYWQTLYNFKIPTNYVTQLNFNDYTVQPGVWYKYQIIRTLANGNVKSLRIIPRMVATQDIFLSSNNKQLRVRFDPQIGNVSIKTSDTVTETLGSQYPFVRRNGKTYYKTFTISGTITHFMDTKNNLFKSSEQDLYSDISTYYNTYNENNNVTPYTNYIYEKDFRQKVIDFLYANDVKLFRSLTEGNMLIKITNVSLTPNATLGRMIYTFSCTATEIDSATFESYNKYKLTNKMEGR